MRGCERTRVCSEQVDDDVEQHYTHYTHVPEHKAHVSCTNQSLFAQTHAHTHDAATTRLSTFVCGSSGVNSVVAYNTSELSACDVVLYVDTVIASSHLCRTHTHSRTEQS